MHIDILYIDGIVTDYNKQFYFEDDCAFGIAKSKTIDDFKTNIFNLLKANRNVLWEELALEDSDTKHAFWKFIECLHLMNAHFLKMKILRLFVLILIMEEKVDTQ